MFSADTSPGSLLAMRGRAEAAEATREEMGSLCLATPTPQQNILNISSLSSVSATSFTALSTWCRKKNSMQRLLLRSIQMISSTVTRLIPGYSVSGDLYISRILLSACMSKSTVRLAFRSASPNSLA